MGSSIFEGTSTGVFGASSSPAFGSLIPGFGSSSTPAFGSSSTSFGGSSGLSSTSAFGTSSSPFGASSSPAFGASSTPAFSLGSTQAFGQPSSAFGSSSSPFGSTTSAFGGQSSAFRSQAPTSAFGNTGIGQSGFGGQRGGSRVVSYSATTEADGGASGLTAKLESISAMHAYKDKSHEELRWEDYQLGDKGGPLPSAQSTGLSDFGSSTPATNAFSPFSSTTPKPNPFAPKTSTFSSGFGTSTSTEAPSNSSTPAFGSSTSLSNTAAQDTSSLFGSIFSGNTQPSQLFSSPALTIAQPGSTFGQNPSPFGLTNRLKEYLSLRGTGSESYDAFANAYGVFRSTPTQTNPFGSATQQPSQLAFGSSIFGFQTGASSHQDCVKYKIRHQDWPIICQEIET